jgi:hypothetical protein
MMKGGIDEQIYDSLSSKSTVIKKIMVSNLVAKEVGRRFGNIVEPPLYGRSPLVEALPLFKAQNEVRKKELLDMAKHSLEDNIERIADALERFTAPTNATVTQTTNPGAAMLVEDAPEAPVLTPKAAKKAAKAIAAPEMDAQGLLAYSNKKVLAINDPEVRKSTVQSIVARLKTECGSTNIKSLPQEKVADAKAIIDEVFKALEDEAALL